MNILLIEPDKLLSQSLRQAIAAAGHDCKVFCDAQSSLDALEGDTFDVVVLEPQLGAHNGIEYLYELRSYADWQRIPVIVHSSNRAVLDKNYQPAWLQLGVIQVFYKPQTSTQQLLRAVDVATAAIAR